MACEECLRLYKDAKRLQDYIEDQSKRHAADMKALREDLNAEIKYSKKLRTELKEEYNYCERLRNKLAEKTRLAEDLKEDLEDERAYSMKLERKLDKRAKIIKELEADLLALEDDYAEARTALKRMDEFRRELGDAKLHRQYEQRRIKQLLEEVTSLRSTSQTSSPYLAPTYATSSPRYVPSPAHASPAAQVHLLPRYAPSPAHVSPAVQARVLSPSPRARTPNLAEQTPTIARQVASPPSSRTPELESDYSEAESDLQEGRLTEEEDEELARAEEDESEYSDAEEPEVPDAEEGDDKVPGQRLRNLAAREGRLADREYERASDAHASGDREFAKKLRDAGAQHRHNMRNYHRMAAAEIFNHHNPEYDLNPSARVKIDLHHLFVREAKEYVERHLDLCRRAKLQRTEIISGRGNHSVGGVAKIRPAVTELLETQQDIEVDEHETNPGRIVVRFSDVGRAGAESDNPSRSPSRPPSRMQDGPRHVEVEDVFEQGRTRLKAASRAAAEVRLGLDEVERGMSSMRINNNSKSKSDRETTRGLDGYF